MMNRWDEGECALIFAARDNVIPKKAHSVLTDDYCLRENNVRSHIKVL